MTPHFIPRIQFIALAWLGLFLATATWTPVFADDAIANAQLQSLRKVWQTIDEYHWDRELIAERWSEILPEFEAKLAETESDDEAREVISSMIQRLGQSHFSIIPSGVYKRQKDLGIRKGNGTVGMEVRLIDGELIVTRLRQASTAAAAGIQIGDRLDRIQDNTADEIIEQAGEKSEFEAGRAETFVGLFAEALLGGAVGDTVPVEWTDSDGQKHTAAVTLAESEGQFAKFGNMPAVEVVLETKLLPEDVIYFRFSSFFNPVPLVSAMKDLMEKHGDARGLIFDVRGNRGGVILLASGLSNWLTTEPISIGIMKGSQSELNLRLNPRKPRFDGKVVVLTDELSISSAEILAGGLQDAALATVIGGRTAGLVLPSLITQLPSGDRFQYAISDFQTGSGRRLEGDGVTPDIAIQPTKKSLQQQGDPVLRRALKWIIDES